MTAANVREKVMIARRGISNSMPTFSNFLTFKLMKPFVYAGEKAASWKSILVEVMIVNYKIYY